jgi:hypothetical protein
MTLNPLASGVIRRALAVYVENLAAPDLDPQREAREVRAACSALSTDEEDRRAAWKRLESLDAGQPFPTFTEVLYGPHRASQWAAFDDRVEALLQQINREGAQHMRRTKAPNP